ncbi:MAG: DUF3788 family protein [Methanobacterium sp.]
MSKGTFTNKNHKPTENEIFDVIALYRPLWDNLIDFIGHNYNIKGEFKFYGKNFGWALRYRKSGRVLISLYPGKKGFMIQIILNGDEIKKALKLDLDSETRKVIDETNPIREGKWIYLEVGPDTSLNDIKKLIMVRSTIKKGHSIFS